MKFLPDKTWTVYILRCKNSSIYTGCTSDLMKRLEKHNNGKVHYTRDKVPAILITYVVFTEKYKAFLFEKYLKSGSGIAFSRRHFL